MCGKIVKERNWMQQCGVQERHQGQRLKSVNLDVWRAFTDREPELPRLCREEG